MTGNVRYALGLARAAGGAIIFALPILMTFEMWTLGFTIDPARLLLLLVLLVPVLALLSYHAGFETTATWRDDAIDAVVAYGIAFCASAGVLWLLGVITSATGAQDAVGKVAVQTVPASIGAMLARTLLAGEHADADRRAQTTYGGEMFLMAIGALFLGFSVAPTDEVVMIAFQLSPAKTIALVMVSLVLMHAFVYAVEFRGQAARAGHVSAAAEFLRLTIPGYAIALLTSGYLLWTFGRADGLHAAEFVRAAVVLGFPAAIGAASARLIL